MKVIEARTRAINTNIRKSSLYGRPFTRSTPSARGEETKGIILLKEWYVRQTHLDRLMELSRKADSYPRGTGSTYMIG